MSKFNLTFNGDIAAGVDPRHAKTRFGKMFQIDDPERLEKFFCGDTIILRRNLDRKTAAQYYSDMQKIGLTAQLVKASTLETVNALGAVAEPSPAKPDSHAERSKPAEEDAKWTTHQDSAHNKTGAAEGKPPVAEAAKPTAVKAAAATEIHGQMSPSPC